MSVVVIYESMYGNTRRVAEAIATGAARLHTPAAVVHVRDATMDVVGGASLLVVGGPTHVHSMSSPRTRAAAAEQAAKPDSGVTLEDGADRAGLREWFASVGTLNLPVAAFDTRLAWPAWLAGRASKRIDRMLRRRGAQPVRPPASFFVGKDDRVLAGEIDRAARWGEELVAALAEPGVGAVDRG